jgi:glycerophosphoryl diester phosphodiesterase
MTLLGVDRSLVGRALAGARAALFPRSRPDGALRPPLLIAHRGSLARAPENTIEACRAGLDAGADGVEVDICVTRDGHPVLWHDPDPDDPIARARRRGSDGAPFVPWIADSEAALGRPVSELTLEEMRRSHGYARRGLPLALGERRVAGVDSLEHLLVWAAGEPRLRALMLDVKLQPHELSRVRPLIATLERTLSRHHALHQKRLRVLCREREIYRALSRETGRRGVCGLKLTADFELPGVLKGARAIGARHVSIGVTPRRTWPAVRDEIIEVVRARRRGELRSVTVWTIEEATRLAELQRIGVDAVLVDDELLGDGRGLTASAAEV